MSAEMKVSEIHGEKKNCFCGVFPASAGRETAFLWIDAAN
jgi:hypothetical protein